VDAAAHVSPAAENVTARDPLMPTPKDDAEVAEIAFVETFVAGIAVTFEPGQIRHFPYRFRGVILSHTGSP
jgi:hypothetical protein